MTFGFLYTGVVASWGCVVLVLSVGTETHSSFVPLCVLPSQQCGKIVPDLDLFVEIAVFMPLISPLIIPFLLVSQQAKMERTNESKTPEQHSTSVQTDDVSSIATTFLMAAAAGDFEAMTFQPPGVIAGLVNSVSIQCHLGVMSLLCLNHRDHLWRMIAWTPSLEIKLLSILWMTTLGRLVISRS
jgi:hypothetical protein